MEENFWYQPCPKNPNGVTHECVGDVEDGPCQWCHQESVQTPDETWEEVAARVTSEETSGRYAASLALSFQAYVNAGFTYDQAWCLVRDEHRSRLEMMGNRAIMDATQGEDDIP